jgi:hypothetical protein
MLQQLTRLGLSPDTRNGLRRAVYLAAYPC